MGNLELFKRSAYPWLLISAGLVAFTIFYIGNKNVQAAQDKMTVPIESTRALQDLRHEALGPYLKAFNTKMSEREKHVVNPHNFQYILNAPTACAEKDVELMVGVPTRIESFDQRQAVRDTWGSFARDPTNKVVVLFFLGKSQSPNRTKLQARLELESLKHGDIVQEDFLDTYRNLSLKSVAIVRWPSSRCQQSSFVLKADDDMYINIPLLLLKLRSQLEKGPLFVMGFLQANVKPIRWIRHKWYVPKRQYKYDEFPNYVSGTSYAMSTTAAMRLYIESFYLKPIFMEDTYVTGILADSASVPRVADGKFAGHTKVEATGCKFKSQVAAHGYSPQELRKIHSELYDPNLKC